MIQRTRLKFDVTKAHQINYCLAYSSRREILFSIKNMKKLGHEHCDNLQSITDALYINNCEVDLLLRTSGETRLSDFLLWQTSNSIISFNVYNWPEFSIWKLIALIFDYQNKFKEKNKIQK